jgi:hypothetical protein
MTSGDATRIIRPSAFWVYRVGPGKPGREGGLMKPITWSWRGIGAKIAVLIGVALLGFPGVPALNLGQQADENILAVPPAASAEPLQTRRPPRRLPPLRQDEPPDNARKRERDLLKQKFEKMKENADELADLAKSLQEDLNDSNENVLSVQVVQKAQKIEKLAKKIRSAARGF